MQSDVCVFTRIYRRHITVGILTAHVDDLLFTGATNFSNEVIRALKVFRTGEHGTSSRKSPISLTGIQIGLGRSGAILLSQEAYIRAVPVMNLGEFISCVIVEEKIRISPRQCLGSLIWAHQSRRDVGFAIARIATGRPQSFESPGKARNIAALYNKATKFVRNHPREINYTACPQLNSDHDDIDDLTSRRIAAFPDAGFGSLTESRSIDGNMLVIGEILSRDGLIR